MIDVYICNSHSKDKSVSLRQFPVDPTKRQAWIDALKVREGDIKAHSRVCCHFPDADPSKTPYLTLGKRFASPKKSWTARALLQLPVPVKMPVVQEIIHPHP